MCHIIPPKQNPMTSRPPANFMWLAVKVIVTVLSIPLMRMELSFLPKWCSDFSYGLMFRLGILFGIVLLVWNSQSPRGLWKLRNTLFLAASVASALITIVVDNLARGACGMFLITTSGAVCLALSHRFILGPSWKQVIAAVILAPGFFYLATYSIDKFLLEASPSQQFLASFAPYYWQLGYLLGMYGMLDLMKKDPSNPPAVA